MSHQLSFSDEANTDPLPVGPVFLYQPCRKTPFFRVVIQDTDSEAIQKRERLHGFRFGIESEKEGYQGYHADKESLPIRADAKRGTYPQDETVLRMCPFRIQPCSGVSESAV